MALFPKRVCVLYVWSSTGACGKVLVVRVEAFPLQL